MDNSEHKQKHQEKQDNMARKNLGVSAATCCAPVCVVSGATLSAPVHGFFLSCELQAKEKWQRTGF